MKTILLIFAMIVPFFCFAQTGLSGIVRTVNSNQPIEGCHVYINEYLGTTTNENGEFKLVIPEKYAGSELHISHVSYKPFILSVTELHNNRTIAMEQAAIILPEVVVSPDPWIIFQESIDEIISSAKDQTDENIYNSIVDKLEKMKPPYEAFYFKPENENRK